MAENPENKEAKPDLFSPAAEALGYISLEQARVLAIRHARDNTDFYGPRYSGINLVWEVISQEDGEDYYDIRLSFRPAGRFRGEPGVEQFVIDKLGNVEIRQMLDEPTGLDLPEAAQESPESQPPPAPSQPTATPPTDPPATGPEPAIPAVAPPTATPPPSPDVVVEPPVAQPRAALPAAAREAPPDRASVRPSRRRFLRAGGGLAVAVVGILFTIGVLIPGDEEFAPVGPFPTETPGFAGGSGAAVPTVPPLLGLSGPKPTSSAAEVAAIPDGPAFNITFVCMGNILGPCDAMNEPDGFVQRVSQRSNGRVEIDTVSFAGLGVDGLDIFDLIADPTLGAVELFPESIGLELPVVEIGTLPGLYSDNVTQLAVAEAVREDLARMVAQRFGGVVLAYNFYPSSFIFSRKSLASEDDFVDLRTRAGRDWADFIAAMGGEPQFLFLDDVYTSLEQGVVDAVIACGICGLERGWFEVSDFLMGPLPGLPHSLITVNGEIWAQMPQVLQEILREEAAIHEASTLRNATTVWHDIGIQENVDQGMDYQPITAELDAIARIVAIDTIVPNWVSRSGGPDSEAASLFNDKVANITGVKIDSAGSAFEFTASAPVATATPASRPGDTVAPPGGAKVGGHVNMAAFADPRDWDPLGSASLRSVAAYSQLYNQLVQFDTGDTSALVCDLCDSWEIDEAGLNWSFSLKDGVRWHDGTALTAWDVQVSLSRYYDPGVPVGRSGLTRNYVLPVEEGGIQAIDEITVDFNLRFPSEAFIQFLAIDYVKILPAHLLEQGIDLNQAKNVIEFKSGSGPFILNEYQRDVFYKVSKSPNYFKKDRPFLDGIDHFIIPDAAALVATMRTEQVQMSNTIVPSFTPEQAFELEDITGGAVVSHFTGPSLNIGLMINVKKRPFDDPRVRKAIYLALNRPPLYDAFLSGTGSQATVFMPGTVYSEEEASIWPGIRPKSTRLGQEDLSEAKRLMAESGFPDGFQTTYDARNVSNYPDYCQAVDQQLRDTLNIQGELRVHESRAGFELYQTARPDGAEGDWALACQGRAVTIPDPESTFADIYLKGAARNYSNWSHPDIEQLHQAQQRELNPSKRADLLRESADFLRSFDDNHWITLTWASFVWPVHRDIKGFNPPQTLNYGFKHEDLWLDR